MKYIVLVPDGMADYPLDELSGLTPLEVAETPNMDFLAKNGKVGRVLTIPKGMSPASDVANLSILGYDPEKYYTGRGPLEAANLGVSLGENDIAFRCNLVTVSEDNLIDYSAGHISNKEASILIKAINKKIGSENVKFFPGVGYRHLMVVRNSSIVDDLSKLDCKPPHDIMGKAINRNLPRGKNAEFIIDLMQKSRPVLDEHEINHVRVDLKENPANMIWLWGQGKKPQLPSFKEKYGVTGSVISAVDLIKGMAKTIGLEAVNVEGATGYYDTNYKGKAEAALKALENHDFVFVHVEATDEAGHNGHIREKINAIKKFDHFIIGRILEGVKKYNDYSVLLLPDHATPISVRTHTSDPVLFVVYRSNEKVAGSSCFSEKEAQKSEFSFDNGCELMDYFILGKRE